MLPSRPDLARQTFKTTTLANSAGMQLAWLQQEGQPHEESTPERDQG